MMFYTVSVILNYKCIKKYKIICILTFYLNVYRVLLIPISTSISSRIWRHRWAQVIYLIINVVTSPITSRRTTYSRYPWRVSIITMYLQSSVVLLDHHSAITLDLMVVRSSSEQQCCFYNFCKRMNVLQSEHHFVSLLVVDLHFKQLIKTKNKNKNTHTPTKTKTKTKQNKQNNYFASLHTLTCEMILLHKVKKNKSTIFFC